MSVSLDYIRQSIVTSLERIGDYNGTFRPEQNS